MSCFPLDKHLRHKKSKPKGKQHEEVWKKKKAKERRNLRKARGWGLVQTVQTPQDFRFWLSTPQRPAAAY
jgi:hypothetical protein